MATALKSTPPAAAKRGLGKGLSALMSESYSQVAPRPEQADAPAAEPAITPAPIGMMNLSDLRPGKFQPRRSFDDTALSELTDSIRRSGVMQPILVRPLPGGQGHEIIAGERRWRASQMAGLTEIPVIVRDLTDSEALELALVENIQRQDLGALEEAAGYRRLIDEFNYTQETLAGMVSKSRSHVTNLLRLLALPQDVQELLNSNVISMGHARALMATDNPSALAQEVVRRGLNVRQTEKLAQDGKQERKPYKPRAGSAVAREAEMQAAQQQLAQQPVPVIVHSQPAPQPVVVTLPAAAQVQTHYQRPKDPDIMALEETLSENLGLKVSIEDRGQSGEITIAYESLEQLDEILRRLGGSI